MKVLSSLGLILISTYCYHEHILILLSVCLFYLFSVLFCRYDFYSTLIHSRAFSLKLSAALYSVIGLSVILIYYLFTSRIELVSFSLIAIPYHILLLAPTVVKNVRQFNEEKKGQRIVVVSLIYECFFFILLYSSVVSDTLPQWYEVTFGLSVAHLVLLGLALAPMFFHFLAKQKVVRRQTATLQLKNIKELEGKIELEKELYLVASQNNLSTLDISFVNRCLNKATTLLNSDKDKASLILTKLSKYMRYQLISNQHQMGTVKNEMNYLRHYLELYNLLDENRFIHLNKDSLAFMYEKLIRTQVLMPLVQKVISYMTEKTSQVQLNIKITSNKDYILLTLDLASEKMVSFDISEIDLANITFRLSQDSDSLGGMHINPPSQLLLEIKVRNYDSR